MNYNPPFFSLHFFSTVYHQSHPELAFLHAYMTCRMAYDENCDSDENSIADGKLEVVQSSAVAYLVVETPSYFPFLSLLKSNRRDIKV